MARNMGGLDPKYWTRWRYFKMVQWPDFKEIVGQILKVLGAFLIVFVVLIVVIPRSIFREWKEKRWPPT